MVKQTNRLRRKRSPLLQTHSCAIPLPPPGRPREQVLGNTVQARLLLHLNGARFGFLRLRQRYDYRRPRDRPHHFGNAEIYAERGLEFPSAKILPRVALVKIGASSRDAASCPNSETPTPVSPPPRNRVIYAALGLPPGGTPSISLIPPKALVVVDVAEAASPLHWPPRHRRRPYRLRS